MTTIDRNAILRRVIFRPYRKGMGPVFRLTVWDAYRTAYGKDILGYRLEMDGEAVFEGEDFGNSPMHAIDSDAAVAGILGFLTLRPGDTDAEYFADYTSAQLAFCREHAEALACEVENRFPE